MRQNKKKSETGKKKIVEKHLQSEDNSISQKVDKT